VLGRGDGDHGSNGDDVDELHVGAVVVLKDYSRVFWQYSDVSLAPQFIRYTVNCTSRDSVSHLLTQLVVYIIARCSSLNITTFCLIHICPVLPHPTTYTAR